MNDETIRLQKEVMRLNFLIGQLYGLSTELMRTYAGNRQHVFEEIQKLVADHIDHNLGQINEKPEQDNN